MLQLATTTTDQAASVISVVACDQALAIALRVYNQAVDRREQASSEAHASSPCPKVLHPSEDELKLVSRSSYEPHLDTADSALPDWLARELATTAIVNKYPMTFSSSSSSPSCSSSSFGSDGMAARAAAVSMRRSPQPGPGRGAGVGSGFVRQHAAAGINDQSSEDNNDNTLAVT
eukprot:m.418077 g.418077  ORF g.418077 m.418077 type:complete len:175 (+) comp20184_c0_seq26:3999-4523(+)